MTKKAPLLSDLGMVNALGWGKYRIWDSMVQLSKRPEMPPQGLSSCPWGRAPVFQYVGSLPPLVPNLYDNRVNRLLALAAEELRPSVDAALRRWGADRIGVILGSTDNGSERAYDAVQSLRESGRFPKDYRLQCQNAHNPAAFLRDFYRLSGPDFAISTACSSSAVAFPMARDFIESGLCDAVILGGADIVSQAVYLGFSSLEAVSPGLCDPFADDRRGITLGEGAALFLMTRGDADEQGLRFLGAGESSDAHHMTAPHPQGLGAEASMTRALDDAGLDAGSIGYLNLHGTGTDLNDAMESRAVHRVFGSSVPCSSTKSVTGHTLGAAGAMEVGICWLALEAPSKHKEEAVLPVHRWSGQRDENLPSLDLLTSLRSSFGLRHAMSNSFAFGGNNCSVIIGRSV